MPGPAKWRTVTTNFSLSSKKVSARIVDERARQVLKFVKRASAVSVSQTEGKRDLPEDRELNRKLAADSVVLLKNDGNILPFSRDIDSIALIGPNMKLAAFCGGGSASLEPYYAVSPLQGITKALSPNVKVEYEVGCYAHAMLPTLKADGRRPDGEQGAVVKFYNRPHSVNNREVIDHVDIRDTFFQLMDYRNPRLDVLFWATLETTFIAPVTGQYEFSITVYGSGNLYIDDKLVVENTENQKPGSSFFGKGTAEEKGSVHMFEGHPYQVKLLFASSPTSKVIQPGVVAFPGGAARVGAALVIDEDQSIARAVRLAKENKHTIVCVGLTVYLPKRAFKCIRNLR